MIIFLPRRENIASAKRWKLEDRKGYTMATNTKGRNARGRSTAQRTGRSAQYSGHPAEQYAPQSAKMSRRAAKKRRQAKRRKRLIAILAAEFVLILILGVGVWGLSKLDKLQDLDVDADDIAINEDMDEDTAALLQGYTNIALFGIDARTIGDLGAGNNSDTIIIASINNETKDVKLVSVYRDSYLNRADDTYGKCNAAYSKGGPKQAIEMLNTNLDLNIQYYVSIDFVALIKTVEALGGLEIDIQEDEWEYVNSYMYETTEITEDYLDHYSPFLTGPGLQTLDGLQTAAYCRIRQTSSNDFGRTQRQRSVISKIVDKAKSAGVGTILSIIDEVFPLVATNIPKTTLIGMATSMMSYELGETTGWPEQRESQKMESKGYVEIPADLVANVTTLHEFLFNETDYYPSSTVLKINDKIISDTGVTAPETDSSGS